MSKCTLLMEVKVPVKKPSSKVKTNEQKQTKK